MVKFIKKYIHGKIKNNVIIMDNGGIRHKSSQVKVLLVIQKIHIVS